MAVNSATKMSANIIPVGARKTRAKIIVFHCINVLSNISLPPNRDCEVQSVKLPCSSMTREIHLLRAFEAGADAVIVLVCPEGTCRYLEGNIRAGKRVARMKRLLDEISLNGRRLNIFNVSQGDEPAIENIINRTLTELANLEANPVA